MINVAFVRGSYLNPFETQSLPSGDGIAITGISSYRTLGGKIPFPVIPLFSPADIPFFSKAVKIISNRTLGDSQLLFNLEKYACKFDLFHTADPHYYYSYQLARLRARNSIRYLIATSWETIPFNNETVYRKKSIKQYTRTHVDRFICYTEKAKHTLMKEGVPAEKIQTVALGINLDRFHPPVSKPNKKYTVLFVGRLVEEKGILDLYSAFRNVSSPAMKLRIIGDGPLYNMIKELIKKDSLESLVTVEKLSYEQMPQAYQSADVLVLPSKSTKTWEEQYGMVLVEAMASGLPIIATKTGSIPEVVGDVGLLYKDGDRQTLAQLLVRLEADETEKRKRGTMGRRRAETVFDGKKTAKALSKLYIEAYEKTIRNHSGKK